MDTMIKFKELQKPGNTSVSKFRRVRHSLSNKFTAKTGRMGLAKDVALEAVNLTATAGGVITGFMVAGLAAGATLGGVAGGAAAFFGAPVLAAVLGVVGIINLAYSSYSNREKAHETLAPYVWNYIDESPPKPIAGNKDVKGAAMSLITDGASQQKLQDQKLKATIVKFNSWVKDYGKLCIYHSELAKYPGRADKLAIYKPLIVKVDAKRVECLDKAFAKGGAIYELMRRLNHRANYMQAFIICGKVFQKDDTELEDFAKNLPDVAKMRNSFKKIAEAIDNHHKASMMCR